MTKQRGVYIAGNWKMNHGPAATSAFFKELASRGFPSEAVQRASRGRSLQSAILAPAISLESAQTAVAQQGWSEYLRIGAQNAHDEPSGAFTGELSGPLLQETGIRLVLIGHSERRQFFGETDESAGRRMASLLSQGFEVIFCIGETRLERETGKTEAVISRQLQNAFKSAQNWLKSRGQDFQKSHWPRLIIAYEPVWAIGTGLTATPLQAQEAHHFIRDCLRQLAAPADEMTLIYGGSVTPENFPSLLACTDIDGGLVGGSSLKAESFLKLIETGAQAI